MTITYMVIIVIAITTITSIVMIVVPLLEGTEPPKTHEWWKSMEVMPSLQWELPLPCRRQRLIKKNQNDSLLLSKWLVLEPRTDLESRSLTLTRKLLSFRTWPKMTPSKALGKRWGKKMKIVFQTSCGGYSSHRPFPTTLCGKTVGIWGKNILWTWWLEKILWRILASGQKTITYFTFFKYNLRVGMNRRQTIVNK
mgnify:CR=1 FL=1